MNVVQSGYVIGERLLRPAMVTIAKNDAAGPRPTNGAGGQFDTKI